MTKKPTYEEMKLGRRGSRGGWARTVLESLDPATPAEVDTGERPLEEARRQLLVESHRLGIPITTRKKGDKLYVVRFRDEDVPK